MRCRYLRKQGRIYMTQAKGRAVIFDLDGVLIDTGEYHRQSWLDLAEQENWQITDEFFYRTFGMQNYQIIPMIAQNPLTDDEIQQCSDWKEARYRQLIAGKLQLLVGVENLIQSLKEQNFKLAVGTSAPRENLDFMLKPTGIINQFDALIASEDVNNGKPAPDTFLAAASQLNIPPVRCVVVEDAVAGVQAARSAGMKVVAVTNTNSREDLHQADIIVDQLTEVTPEDFQKLIAAEEN